jgi:hypothetical protein
MAREFNVTGTCVATKHYMVDTSKKIDKVLELVEKGKYFTINRPRQYGKTTTISLLWKRLIADPDYFAIRMSFEGIGDAIFESDAAFSPQFVDIVADNINMRDKETATLIRNLSINVVDLKTLSQAITEWVRHINKKIVVIIDEVDKSSNNQLFVSFLGMLRDKYLKQNEGQEVTFHSVVLAGVYDVKTLKLKIASDFSGKLNSPWNIAADFKLDMSFNAIEIATMLVDYSKDKKIEMDIPAISERLYYYTSGYPYLVSKMCKIIDEEILPEKDGNRWEVEFVDLAFESITYPGYTTTIFDDLFKNLENNQELSEIVFNLVINGMNYEFNLNSTEINLGFIYGIWVDNKNKGCKIHNRIFEQRLFNYYLSKAELKNDYEPSNFTDKYYTKQGLNHVVILQKFQEFFKENYSKKDQKFIEREGRLIFLSFLKPIINGKGYVFKEPVVGDERRTDIVVTYYNERDIIELKRWYGEKYHLKGLQQLSDYLDIYSLKKGYLLIFDFNAGKQYREEMIQFGDKQIFAVWV